MKSVEQIADTLRQRLRRSAALGIIPPHEVITDACGLTLAASDDEIMAVAAKLHAGATRGAAAAVEVCRSLDPTFGTIKAKRAAERVEREAQAAIKRAEREARTAERAARTTQRRAAASAKRAEQAATNEAERAVWRAKGYVRRHNPARLAALSDEASTFNEQRKLAGITQARIEKGQFARSPQVMPRHLDARTMDLSDLRRKNNGHLPATPKVPRVPEHDSGIIGILTL